MAKKKVSKKKRSKKTVKKAWGTKTKTGFKKQ